MPQLKLFCGALLALICSLPAQALVLDTKELNQGLLEHSQQAWTDSPISIALKWSGPDAELLSRSLSLIRPEKERMDRAQVVVIDSVLDDSIDRIMWRFLFEEREGNWQVVHAEQLFRCWRSKSEAYRSRPCS